MGVLGQRGGNEKARGIGKSQPRQRPNRVGMSASDAPATKA